jgi:type IV secretory pathway TrbF-like protein
MTKKKEPQNSEIATQLAEHLTNIRKLVLDADQLAHQAIQEANSIKRLIERSKKE